MVVLPLIATPNQKITPTLDNSYYEITIKEADGIMACDISRDGVVLQTGNRIVAGYPLINFQYLATGNFVLTTANQEIPYYTQFGITQFLVFATQSELQAIANGTEEI